MESDNRICPDCRLILEYGPISRQIQRQHRHRLQAVKEQVYLEFHLSPTKLPYSLPRETLEQLSERIRELVHRYPGDLEPTDRMLMLSYLQSHFFGFGILSGPVRNQLVTHIYIRRWDKIYLEHCGRLEEIKYQYESELQLLKTINNLMYPQILSKENPFIIGNLSQITVPYNAENKKLSPRWMVAFLNHLGEPSATLSERYPNGGEGRIPTDLPVSFQSA